MAENKLNNKGYLSVNKERKTDKQPNYRGKIHINDKEYWIAGWDSDKDGVQLIKLTITDPEEYKKQQTNQSTGATPNNNTAQKPKNAPLQASDFEASIEDIEALYKNM